VGSRLLKIPLTAHFVTNVSADEAAKAFYESDDYAPALALRKSIATTNLVIVDGYTPPEQRVA
jgi:uncharacterized protein (DUF1330 family)